LIALVTENPRFYYVAVRELARIGAEFLSLNLGEDIPDFVKVVLTSTGEKDAISFSKIIAADDLRYAVAECLKISMGIEHVNKLVIGIDPGLKPGMAVFADGTLVDTERLGSPEEVLETVQRFISIYGGRKSIVRVGMGGGIYHMRILRSLQEALGDDVVIETIDETATTPETGTMPSPELKDIVAAVNIALKNGDSLKRRVNVNPTEGEIKQLQRASRKLNGNITISRELAVRVALGELTLDAAVKEQATKNGLNRDKKAAFNR
jgi:hypothetical protein